MLKFLVQLHPLNDTKITNYFNDEPRFNGAFSRKNLFRIRNGAHDLNLDDKNNKGTHSVSLLIDKSTVVSFDSLRIEHIAQEVLNKIR